jgi:flagellar motility protein MotE (MotC chaperone)
VSQAEDWTHNYFNYFTEIEEHFQKARGTGLFLLSTLDWALIESWKNSGVPLEAVLRGIDAAFEKWRSRKSKIQVINSLAYCTQAVLTEAQAMAGLAPPSTARPAAPPFGLEELRCHLTLNASELHKRSEPIFQEIAAALERLAAEVESHYQNLEELERHLAALEDRMIAASRTLAAEEDLVAARRELDFQLRPYRGKMTAEQLATLERQFLDRRLLESAGLSRLSLFYMR